MKALIQRVSSAYVQIDGEIFSEINKGLLVLLGVEKHDTKELAAKLANKVANYRIFSDDSGHMNLSAKQINAQILVVSQFTLAANTHKGLRPSFSEAASPEMAKLLYEYFITQLQPNINTIKTGVFAANMQVGLVNDGPVTFDLNL
jgi:D-tyrosyl-tRNA(Tyr) deacylase